jgi:hypothetical protein
MIYETDFITKIPHAKNIKQIVLFFPSVPAHFSATKGGVF